jgi:hypothetical protein
MFSRGELLMEAAGREKRRFVRRHCALPIELGTGGTSYPLTSETSDVSPFGNGIDFTGISAEQQNRLQSYLDEIKAPVADSDFIFR